MTTFAVLHCKCERLGRCDCRLPPPLTSTVNPTDAPTPTTDSPTAPTLELVPITDAPTAPTLELVPITDAPTDALKVVVDALLGLRVDPPPPTPKYPGSPPGFAGIDLPSPVLRRSARLHQIPPTSPRAPLPLPAPPTDHPDPLPAPSAKWTEDEDQILLAGVKTHGKNWVAIHIGFPEGTKRSVDSLRARYGRLEAAGKAGKGKDRGKGKAGKEKNE
ncbi:hypothetical protein V6N13_002785 [Hibiscus sabdariffa]|uniref:Myb-like domain-containing protein n=2 Tax=Hibiscus sabdariffa TaxID=183260 RepID=A0ABR2BG41_9ROSI